MKIIYWLGCAALASVVLLGLVLYVASEAGGEVVPLFRSEPAGGHRNICIWIVDEGVISWVGG